MGADNEVDLDELVRRRTPGHPEQTHAGDSVHAEPRGESGSGKATPARAAGAALRAERVEVCVDRAFLSHLLQPRGRGYIDALREEGVVDAGVAVAPCRGEREQQRHESASSVRRKQAARNEKSERGHAQRTVIAEDENEVGLADVGGRADARAQQQGQRPHGRHLLRFQQQMTVRPRTNWRHLRTLRSGVEIPRGLARCIERAAAGGRVDDHRNTSLTNNKTLRL